MQKCEDTHACLMGEVDCVYVQELTSNCGKWIFYYTIILEMYGTVNAWSSDMEESAIGQESSDIPVGKRIGQVIAKQEPLRFP